MRLVTTITESFDDPIVFEDNVDYLNEANFENVYRKLANRDVFSIARADRRIRKFDNLAALKAQSSAIINNIETGDLAYVVDPRIDPLVDPVLLQPRIYIFDYTDTAPEDLIDIVKPNVGPGRWRWVRSQNQPEGWVQSGPISLFTTSSTTYVDIPGTTITLGTKSTGSTYVEFRYNTRVIVATNESITMRASVSSAGGFSTHSEGFLFYYTHSASNNVLISGMVPTVVGPDNILVKIQILCSPGGSVSLLGERVWARIVRGVV